MGILKFGKIRELKKFLKSGFAISVINCRPIIIIIIYYETRTVVHIHREAEKRIQFSFVCIYLNTSQKLVNFFI